MRRMLVRKLAGTALLLAMFASGRSQAQTPAGSPIPAESPVPAESPTPAESPAPAASPIPTPAGADSSTGAGTPTPDPAAASPALTICAVTGTDSTPVPGATVILVAPDGSAGALATGEDGCVRIPRLPATKYRVTVAAAGTTPKDFEVDVPAAGGVLRNVRLEIATATTEETIVVEARREQPGETRRVIEPEIARTLPGSQGDALKAVQNLPGLARASFGGSALIVRGAAPEDTRVFLDGQQIPQLYHFGGLTSVVATEMLQSIDFLPGGFGVRYGRALSGVVDVETRPAAGDEWSGILDADIYDTSVFAEGPLGYAVGDAGPAMTSGTAGEIVASAETPAPSGRYGRVLAAGRRSYIDFILPQVVPQDVLTLTVAPRYYDYQLRYDAPDLEDGTKTHVLAYGSDDAFTFILKDPPDEAVEFRGQFLFRTLFHQAQAGITKPLANGWLLSATPAFAHQQFLVQVASLAGIDATLQRGSARVEARGNAGEKLRLLLGTEAEVNQARYKLFFDAGGEGFSLDETARYEFGAGSVYAQAEILRGPLTIVPGIRMDAYWPVGAVSFDPRVAVRYEPSKAWFAKAYAGLYHQPPAFQEWDVNVGNPDLRPPYAIQSGIGGGRSLGEHTRIEGELFHKWLGDLVVDVPGDPGDPGAAIDETSNEGIGRAYGAEVLLKRELTEKLYGWIAYTLSKSELADPYERGGWRPFEYDQTHILTALAGYRLPRGWELGVRMRYATGNPTTFNEGGIYDVDGDEYIPLPGDALADRIPPFHQLDVRVDKRWDFKRWNLGLYLDVQNVYLQENPESVGYNFDYEERYYVTGLPILPSIGVRGEF